MPCRFGVTQRLWTSMFVSFWLIYTMFFVGVILSSVIPIKIYIWRSVFTWIHPDSIYFTAVIEEGSSKLSVFFRRIDLSFLQGFLVMCDNILRNEFCFLFFAFLLAYYVFQEEFNLLYLQSCCYCHMFDLLLWSIHFNFLFVLLFSAIHM